MKTLSIFIFGWITLCAITRSAAAQDAGASANGGDVLFHWLTESDAQLLERKGWGVSTSFRGWKYFGHGIYFGDRIGFWRNWVEENKHARAVVVAVRLRPGARELNLANPAHVEGLLRWALSVDPRALDEVPPGQRRDLGKLARFLAGKDATYWSGDGLYGRTTLVRQPGKVYLGFDRFAPSYDSYSLLPGVARVLDLYCSAKRIDVLRVDAGNILVKDPSVIGPLLGREEVIAAQRARLEQSSPDQLLIRQADFRHLKHPSTRFARMQPEGGVLPAWPRYVPRTAAEVARSLRSYVAKLETEAVEWDRRLREFEAQEAGRPPGLMKEVRGFAEQDPNFNELDWKGVPVGVKRWYRAVLQERALIATKKADLERVRLQLAQLSRVDGQPNRSGGAPSRTETLFRTFSRAADPAVERRVQRLLALLEEGGGRKVVEGILDGQVELRWMANGMAKSPVRILGNGVFLDPGVGVGTLSDGLLAHTGRLEALAAGRRPAEVNVKGGLRSEATGAGKFAAAFMVKEGAKALQSGDPEKIREAAQVMATTDFWLSFGTFVGASHATNRGLDYAKVQRKPAKYLHKLIRGTVPLAVGMAASEALTGKISPERLAVSTASFAGIGGAVNIVGDRVVRAALKGTMPTRLAGSVYEIGKLAATLYGAESAEALVHEREEFD